MKFKLGSNQMDLMKLFMKFYTAMLNAEEPFTIERNKLIKQ